jgi:hypothetical protein
MKTLLLSGLLAATSLFAQLDEDAAVPYIPFEIKMGKHFDVVQANCLTCHSFGYVLNQGPQSKEAWSEKVNKMVTAFKAPISNEDKVLITEYLFEYYGNGKEK